MLFELLCAFLAWEPITLFSYSLFKLLCPYFLKPSSQSGARGLGICRLIEAGTNLNNITHLVVRVNAPQSLANLSKYVCDN